MLIQYYTIIFKRQCNDGKKTDPGAQESRRLVRDGVQDLCIAHSGASSLSPQRSGDGVDYVTVEYDSTCRG
jgi:hypothetical protein